ncbi:MAG: aminotransferase class V-fold PLP-dependent enzyme, partial [Planctomycetota bacterium]
MNEPKRRYLDNAATSFPKAPGVVEAVNTFLTNVGVSAGRSGFREALAAESLLKGARHNLRKLFGCGPEDHVVFGLNGTDALNTAIHGLLRPGDHVVTSAMEHNSVLRPLRTLVDAGRISLTIVEADPRSTIVTPDEVRNALRPDTRLVVMTHASNVTGALQPVAEVGALCREHNALMLLDAAQTAGHVPIDFGALPVDLIAAPGHKGLLGPLGTGVLVIRAGVEEQLAPLRQGGTGSLSEQPTQPRHLPDRLEAGSHNVPGVAGLAASSAWLLERGVSEIRAAEQHLAALLIDRLEACAGLRWFGPRDERRVAVFSVVIDGLEPAELSAILEQRFGILTRSGLHCAPLAHRTIGTAASGGTTRISPGPFTTTEDIDAVG